MKIVKKHQRKGFSNSPVCRAFEYALDDKDINGAVIELTGRYPEHGYVVNTICKELVYVIGGSGYFGMKNRKNPVAQGDVLLIQPGEQYYWEGNCTLFTPCVPAWYQEQHKEIE